jgi:hypothetical protein
MTVKQSHIDVLAPDREEVDPELLELPDPPKGERRTTLALLVITAVAALVMVFSLRWDTAYAFASPMSIDVGDLRTADVASFQTNSYIEAHGMLASSSALRYERPFESDTYRIAPVAGQPNVYVEVRVPAGEEGARYVPKETFSGRLVPFDKTGLRHRGLPNAIGNELGQSVPANAWLVVDGEAPKNARWAVTLTVIFGLFALWNLFAFLRLVRKVK